MKNVFFIGISGIGMSALAKIMLNRGYKVFGSDLQVKKTTLELESMGAKIFNSHQASNIAGIDIVVCSSAIKPDNPEYSSALANNIPIIKRGELLAQLLNEKNGIAVAGTHGKTTTSSMLGAVMLDLDPTIVVGGIVPEIGSNAKFGGSEYFVAEADESDNSFLYLEPCYSIITNVEADHLENHGCFDNIKESFKKFMDQTKDLVLANKDCQNLSAVSVAYQNVVTYSTETQDADIYAKNIKVKDGKFVYEVVLNGENLGEFKLSIPGKHNVSNSLGVIYLALKFGVELENLKEKLEKFKGAKRRYDIIHDNNIKIIDDYAHHPTEIRATLQAAKNVETGSITAIFQPHRFSRVKFLLEEFKGVFDQADRVVLLPVYSAGEQNSFNVTLGELAEKIGKDGIDIFEDSNQVRDMVKNGEKGSVFIFMGAGDISSMAYKISDEIKGEA